MSPEELDEARAAEAFRIWKKEGSPASGLSIIAARLAREGWKPPEPVDPDVLAFREWFSKRQLSDDDVESALAGHYDKCSNAQAYLAGARMATERERERAKVLLEFVRSRADHVNPSERARAAIAEYEEGLK